MVTCTILFFAESLDNEGETSMPEELKPDVKPPAIKLQGIQEGPGDPSEYFLGLAVHI